MAERSITLPELLTVKTVSEVKAQFAELVKQASADVCVVDCVNVTRIDALGLQLLLAAKLALGQRGGGLVLRNGAERLAPAVATLGLDADLVFES